MELLVSKIDLPLYTLIHTSNGARWYVQTYQQYSFKLQLQYKCLVSVKMCSDMGCFFSNAVR